MCECCVCACVCVCACESDRTDLPSCPVPCHCAYTGVNVCSWISLFFSFIFMGAIDVQVSLPFGKIFGSTFEDFSLSFFFFIDLTGLFQCAVLQ